MTRTPSLLRSRDLPGWLSDRGRALDPFGVEVVTVHHTAHDAKKESPAGMAVLFGRLR